MINIGVCDDNEQFAELMAQHLKRLCAYAAPQGADIKVLSPFFSSREVVSYLKGGVIDILFLDIDMKETSGFELAKMLCEIYPDTVIIFVSAYEELVYSSFEYCPFRFLRKSRLASELESTFEKVIEKCLFGKRSMPFESTDGEIILRIKDILYFEGQKNYYVIYTRHGKEYRCRGTMKSLLQKCGGSGFFRIHSAYIVNMCHIESVNAKGYVVMKNARLLSVSSRRMSEFKHSYMQFLRRGM